MNEWVSLLLGAVGVLFVLFVRYAIGEFNNAMKVSLSAKRITSKPGETERPVSG
jgi:hypothetical protein